jgi:hypothetical protein
MFGQFMVIVFNATFNIISVISWRSVLLVEETGVNGETTDLSQITDKIEYHNVVLSITRHMWDSNSQMFGKSTDDYIRHHY